MEHHHVYADNATDHAPGSHPVIDCDGTEIWRTYGTWKGHVGPGTVFLIWGAWWVLWVLWTYVRRGAKRFEARPWYGPTLGGRVLPVEPIIKLAGPLIISYIELYGDHDEFRTLTCKDGRFAMTHMNNWQHASVYPGFLLAAALDWAAMAVPLPPGMQQVAMGFAFFVEGFLMANHRKHEPLDQTVHQLLVVAIYGTVAAIAAELWRPRSVVAALGRGFFAMLQGAWLVQIALIMWGGAPRWDLNYMGSAMMPPVYFVWIAVTIAACICACYVAMHVAVQHLLSSQYSLLPQTQHDPVKSVGIGGKARDLSGLVGGLFSREASAAPDKLAAAEAADLEAASHGGSFSGSLLQGGMRRQASMHMRSDSANSESVHGGGSAGGSLQNSPRSENNGDGRLAFGVSPFSIAGARARQDW